MPGAVRNDIVESIIPGVPRPGVGECIIISIIAIMRITSKL